MVKEKHTRKSEIKEGVSKGIFSGFLASLCCVGPLIIVLFGLGSVSFALSISQYKLYFVGIGILFMIGAISLHLNKKNKACDENYFSIKELKKEKTFIISVIISMIIIYILAIYVLVPLVSPIIYKNAVSKEVQISSLENFEQICKDNGDSWMKMKPMINREFTSNLDCFGCMPDEKNHICNLDEYSDFDRSNIKTTENSVNQNITITNSDLNKLNVKISGMTCIGCASGVQSILQSLDGVVESKVNYNEGIGEIIYNPNIITKEQIINSDAFSYYPGEIISDKKK